MHILYSIGISLSLVGTGYGMSEGLGQDPMTFSDAEIMKEIDRYYVPNYPCHLCNYPCSTEKGRRIHVSRFHNQSILNFDQYKICMKCSEKVMNTINHVCPIRGKAYRGYECDICLMRFIRKKSFEAHLDMHEMTLSYKCSQCLAAFSLVDTLEDHKKRHRMMNRDYTINDVFLFKKQRK